MGALRTQQGAGPDRQNRQIRRWECHCRVPPVLLATYDESGVINIKARDRYWTVHGTVQAHCPLCGAEHTLDLEPVESAT